MKSPKMRKGGGRSWIRELMILGFKGWLLGQYRQQIVSFLGEVIEMAVHSIELGRGIFEDGIEFLI